MPTVTIAVPSPRRPPTPVGVIIAEEFEARGMTVKALAAKLGLPLKHTRELLAGERGIGVRLAFALAETFGTTAEFWMKLQIAADLWTVRNCVPERTHAVVTAAARKRIMRRFSRPASDRS